jgi:hypothetical protein
MTLSGHSGRFENARLVLQFRIEKEPSLISGNIELLEIDGVAADCVSRRFDHKPWALFHLQFAGRRGICRLDCLSDTNDRHA